MAVLDLINGDREIFLKAENMGIKRLRPYYLLHQTNTKDKQI